MPSWRRLLAQITRRVWALAFAKAGNRRLASIVRIEMTTRSSMRVKACPSRACPVRPKLRVCSKINSDFAGGCLAVWLGASDEHTRQRSVRSEQQRQTAKQPQPSGAGRRLAICFFARRSQPTGGDAPGARAEAPRVLASGQAALPPKSEVIFEQTLRGGSHLAHRHSHRISCIP